MSQALQVFSTALLYAAILLPLAYVTYLFVKSPAVRAVFWRNVLSYFSGILGYLFIVVFVVAAAFLAFNSQFFTNNLANLDQLTEAFPLLLLFIVPAITMTAWSEERKQGTDELLFTLPARDVEILIGKYLAVLAVYTIALVFSMSLWAVLANYSSPGLRLFVTTYLGYWLAGASLLAAGMFASALTRSATVAFVVGAIICAVPVFLSTASLGTSSGFLKDVMGNVVDSSLTDPLRAFSIAEHLHEFSLGVIQLSSVLYFESLAVLMLYLNLVVITERHWSRNQQWNMGLQYALRAACVLAVLVSLNVVAGQASARVDLTPQKFFTLSQATRDVIDHVEPDRPITIQAFLSPEVPSEFVPVRKRLVGLLRQIDQIGGGRIEVRIQDTTLHSLAADEAQSIGIEPQTIGREEAGKQVVDEVFMGLVVTSSYDEVIVPFIGVGTPVEYELTRSLRTVSNAQRLTVGVLETEAQPMSWEIINELRQQYNVEAVAADAPIEREKQLFALEEAALVQAMNDSDEDSVPEALRELFEEKKTRLSRDVAFKVNVKNVRWTLTDNRINRKYVIKKIEEEKTDPPAGEEAGAEKKKPEEKTKPKYGVHTDRYDVVLAIMPSLLTQPQMDNFVAFIKDGGPTLIFDDPVPLRFRSQSGALVLAPRLPPPPQQQQMGPRADGGKATTLLNALNISWDNGEVAWDFYNPFPEYEEQWVKGLFTVVGNRPGFDQAVNQQSEVTNGLGRMILLFAGSIRERANNKMEFTPLLRSGTVSGVFSWDEITEPDFDPLTRSPGVRLKAVEEEEFVVDEFSHVFAAHVRSKKDGKINAIYVADCDMVSDIFFELRRDKFMNLELDNVSFVLNAVDVLATETSFLELRRRKAPQPTLTKLERQKESLREEQQEAIKAAKEEAENEKTKTKERFEKLTEELQGNTELSDYEKVRQLSMTAFNEQQRLAVANEKIEDQLNKTVDQAESEYERAVNRTENEMRLQAILLPALPAIVLGLLFLFVRLMDERKEIAPERRR